MASLARCPRCDTFVKPASIEAGSCPFCPAAAEASRRNPIPGVALAVAIAAAPACWTATPVYGSAPEPDAASTDAGPSDAGASDANATDAMKSPGADGAPIYGVAPESE